MAIDHRCGWGCIAGENRCAEVVPSGSGSVVDNAVTTADFTEAGLTDVILGDGVTIDSQFGRIGTGNNAEMFHDEFEGVQNGIGYQQRGAFTLFNFKSLTLEGTVTLIGDRPIVLVADGAVTINGTLVARGLCSGSVAGPGGFAGGNGSGSSGAGSGGGDGAASPSTGGGGGGYGGSGAGGKTEPGGDVFGNAEISLLLGGGGGGAGSGGGNFGRGGGGGGALHIVSNTKIEITGGINNGGCGGDPGTGNSDSGGGGGAGGAILLEAPIVTVTGALAVNGGGGGGGGGNTATAGADGTLDRTPAAGGSGAASDEGGGSGAAGSVGPGSGAGGSNPGGGGGAIGRIRVNTKGNMGAMLTGATLSPAPSDIMPTFTTGSAATK